VLSQIKLSAIGILFFALLMALLILDFNMINLSIPLFVIFRISNFTFLK